MLLFCCVVLFAFCVLLFFFFFLFFLFLFLTGIHTSSDLSGAQDHAWRGVKYAVGCGGSRSSPVCVSLGEAKDAIEVEATCASLLGSPTPWKEAGESYGKTSFLPVL